MCAYLETAHEYGAPPFPGAVTEWSDGDFYLAYAWLKLKSEAEQRQLEESKAKAKEEREEAERQKRIPGTFGGGGAGRTTSAPIITTEVEMEE